MFGPMLASLDLCVIMNILNEGRATLYLFPRWRSSLQEERKTVLQKSCSVSLSRPKNVTVSPGAARLQEAM